MEGKIFNQPPSIEKESIKLEVEGGFESFIPKEFKENPMGYFEEFGKNIKSGEIKYKDSGEISEDPTAVKDLPTWENESGERIFPVGKRINTQKSQVAKTANPFHEYEVMKIAQEFNLPCAQPMLKVEQGENYLIISEKIEGFRWTDIDATRIKALGFTEEDLNRLKNDAEVEINRLKAKYEEIGLVRTWKLKDMVFDIDLENKILKSVTPTDWERTVIDTKKLEMFRSK